jgi:exodeoxyribonuclease-5
MNRQQLYITLRNLFGHVPTEGQEQVMRHLSAFLLSEKSKPVYLLKGYAGTGKTSIVASLVKTLPLINMRFVLLAPTGRAAKVLTSYSGFQAHTIHRKIYFHTRMPDGRRKMVCAENKHTHCVFIVDEASMITDSATEVGRSLLDDLMQYIFSGLDCRMLLIGDHAQLPPVGSDFSPALDLQLLRSSYDITAASFELTEVMRQALDSGILFNATNVRQKLAANDPSFPLLNVKPFSDFLKLEPDQVEDLFYNAFGGKDFSKAVVICRSNKRANQYNQAIRQRILGMDFELSSGDLLMIVKNNYFWTDEQKSGGFIANGDIAEVTRINKFEELYGFHFADVDICFIEFPDQPTMSVKLLTDTLMMDGPALSESDHLKLSAAVEEDYMYETSRAKRWALIKEDPYFNALQVKYAYALTCHKTQGGQWPWVFLDSGIYQPEQLDSAYLRWLYTAITRATKIIYLMNFLPEFFDET